MLFFPSGRRARPAVAALAAALMCLTVAACASSSQPAGERVLTVGAIPDQDPQLLQRQFSLVSDHLARRLDVEVRYRPVTDYTAAVTAFRRGDLDLVWFGGLTGVQARLQVPGARALAQRDIDADFRSVFIASTASGVEPFDALAGLRALAGETFTFGSQVSTSGRLMPQYFLGRAGVGLEDFAGQVGFSGSHDRTIALVESGSYAAGALNEQVWDQRRRSGEVDAERVREVFRTPPYNDYHWVIRPDVDERLGEGLSARVREALLGLDGDEPTERRILQLFDAGSFIPTSAKAYRRIEVVGRATGLIR